MRKGRIAGTVLALLTILSLAGTWMAAPALAQSPVNKRIPWGINTASFATGEFVVMRSLSYFSSGAPVCWTEELKENFIAGKANIFLGATKSLGSVDFSKQPWITIKVKSKTGTWVTVSKNLKVGSMTFYSLWSDTSRHSEIADQATQSDNADTATICANWRSVSCPDGQCLKGFTSTGTPTCVPCGSGGGGTPTSIPFDQTNWIGHYWDMNNDIGDWFPSVSAGVATYNSTDTVVGQTISTTATTRDKTVSFEVNISLNSGGDNGDRGCFGFSTGYVVYNTLPLVAIEFSADGNAYLTSKSGDSPLPGVMLGSYTKNAWIPVTFKLTAGGNFVATINGASSTNNVTSSFSLTTFNIVITELGTSDGFQVRNLSIL